MKTTNELTDLQSGIVKFQVDGNDWIISEILWKATQPFMENPTRRRYYSPHKKGGQIYINLNSNMDYIAYTIRAKQELAKASYRGKQNDWKSKEFNRLISIVNVDFHIWFDVKYDKWDGILCKYTITTELLDAIYDKMDELVAEVYPIYLEPFLKLCEDYRQEIALQKETNDKALAAIDENTVEALKHALKYVDPSRSDREIVRFINRTWTNKFTDLEKDRNGIKRIERLNNRGNTVAFFVKTHFPNDRNYLRVLFDDIEYKPENCSRMQVAFVAAILKLIEIDAENGDLRGYSCNKTGEARIKHSYIAEKLGVKAPTIRKRIERIKKKSHTF
ncbi:hypothetical protein [Rummeliibacillus pycnus]|uniref:hypothetical protein n=1 Tax=Rummeliibacillus pycnus TaxID=101070 RepID=UPI000C9B9D82|nr:hypothetical protein [Rummeliibacillus pycnus]